METQGPGLGARWWLLRWVCGMWLLQTASSCPKTSCSCCGCQGREKLRPPSWCHRERGSGGKKITVRGWGWGCGPHCDRRHGSCAGVTASDGCTEQPKNGNNARAVLPCEAMPCHGSRRCCGELCRAVPCCRMPSEAARCRGWKAAAEPLHGHPGACDTAATTADSLPQLPPGQECSKAPAVGGCYLVWGFCACSRRWGALLGGRQLPLPRQTGCDLRQRPLVWAALLICARAGLSYFSKLHRGKWDQHKILLVAWSAVGICPSARELGVKLLMALGYCQGSRWQQHPAAQERGSRNTAT